jgi:LacI family transcriptional regulator
MATATTATTTTVAVLLDTDFGLGAQILAGVQEVARLQAAWQVVPLLATQESLLDELLRQGRLDGVIGPFMSDRWLAGLPGRRVPMVNVSSASDVRTVPSVVTDDAAVGRLAARHLLDNGWRNLGCVLDGGSQAAKVRSQGFTAAAAAAGITVHTPPTSDGYAPDATWPDWLRHLPRPCGLFGTSDYVARRLLGHVRSIGWQVPDDAAVAGVGDSALDSILAGIGLSSVALPGRRIGQRAATRLAALLAGGDSAPETERLAPEDMVVRASSARVLHQDPFVARALGRMQLQLSQPLDMATLARQCSASRRTLELRFRSELGLGPAAEWRRRRMALACRLLTETDRPLADIAGAAGFAELPHFWTAFKAAMGCTPGAYRRRGTRSA